MLSAVDIETHSQQNEAVQQECRLPKLADVGLRIDEKDEALDHACKLNAAGGHAGNPS
jgi:hypothetical protein